MHVNDLEAEERMIREEDEIERALQFLFQRESDQTVILVDEDGSESCLKKQKG